MQNILDSFEAIVSPVNTPKIIVQQIESNNTDELDGYRKIPQELWPHISRNSTIRYSLHKKPAKFIDAIIKNVILTTGSAHVELQNVITRDTTRYCLDELHTIYRKYPADNLVDFYMIQASLTAKNDQIKHLQNRIKVLEDDVKQLQKLFIAFNQIKK